MPAGSPPGTSITTESSAAIFIVLRRMRGPLILVIAVFAIGVVGLSLIPGDSPDGPWRMGLFDSFYFMSYTATTIGYGEIPQPFNTAQRMWVVFMIFLGVVSWAYAIGRLLSLLQQSAFKEARALQRFRRRVAAMREPFWLVVGHGQTGEAVGRGIDRLGRRFVAVDTSQGRIDVLDLGSYAADVPAIVGDGRDPELLSVGGLANPLCAGVLALTDDDEANLAVVMAAATLRPGLHAIARCQSRDIARRMHVFGSPTVINPFDRFGDHFRVELRSPAVEQLSHWISAPPGSPLPVRMDAMQQGAWVVCGYGRFGEEITRDLRDAGLVVTVIDRNPDLGDAQTLRGDATDPDYLAVSGVEEAAGFVAGSDNDTTNLSLVAAARRVNPQVVVVARQNEPRNADLFDAMDVDLLMVPSRVVAEEALAYIGTPSLRIFLEEVRRQDDAWAAALLERIRASSGDASPLLWTVTIEPSSAPALCRALGRHPVTVGDLVRDPADRDHQLAAVPLLWTRGAASVAEPSSGQPLEVGDTVLMAGDERAEHAMLATLQIDSTTEYVLTGREVPTGWLWRTITRSGSRA